MARAVDHPEPDDVLVVRDRATQVGDLELHATDMGLVWEFVIRGMKHREGTNVIAENALPLYELSNKRRTQSYIAV
jgi:hypothetical protein